MGRHRRHIKDSFGGSAELERIVEKRLGHDDLICARCNAHNHQNADKCRKCGHTQLRKKAKDFRE